MISIQQFEQAKTKGKNIFEQIRRKYPSLRAYLVLRFKSEQADIDEAIWKLLLHCPRFFLDASEKEQALAFLALEKVRAEKTGQEHITEIERILRKLDLLLNPDVQIEIRFIDLKYALVWELQKEELVDQELTPQTKASIQIMLGSLDSLNRRAI